MTNRVYEIAQNPIKVEARTVECDRAVCLRDGVLGDALVHSEVPVVQI